MTASKKFVKEVLIQDVEKRRQPSKHYVYCIKVSWSDGKIHLIYRRYSQFFSLQDSLISLYPKESGVQDPLKRILPLLPGKILFGRSQIREVALKRKELINEYLQKLIKLPEHLSKSGLIIEFLTVTEDDVNDSSKACDTIGKGKAKTADNISDPILLEQYVVVANFEKNDRNQVSLACGDTVEVIEKNDNGWWFVSIEDEQGWAPSSYLEPVDGVREDERGVTIEQVEKFICVKNYYAQQSDELTLKLGDICTVNFKQRDGWWTVRLCVESGMSKEGVVPAAHLKKFLKSTSVSDDPQKGDKIQAPPRQNTVKKTKRPKPKRPMPSSGTKSQATSSDNKLDEEVVYECARDYEEVDSGGTGLVIRKGAEIKVLEKTPNGWWRVLAEGQEGWIPSNVAQRKRRFKSDQNFDSEDDVVDKITELFITTCKYDTDVDGGLSFDVNQIFQVLDKDPNGWWYVSIDMREGWVPSNYLKSYNPKTKRNSLTDITVEDNSLDEVYENVQGYVNTNETHPPPTPITVISPGTPKPTVPPKPKPRVLPKPSVVSVNSSQNDKKEVDTKLKNSDPVSIPMSIESFKNEKGEVYVALADYEEHKDETMLSFKAGQLLLVTQKEDNGWWFAEYSDQGGWVPSNYLKPN